MSKQADRLMANVTVGIVLTWLMATQAATHMIH